MLPPSGPPSCSPVASVMPHSPSPFSSMQHAPYNGGVPSPNSMMGQMPPATPSMPVDEFRRPKHLTQWTNADVMKWLKRHCEEYYIRYSHMFLQHEITGRTLCRITEVMLQRIGIQHSEHREELCRTIVKLKLKSDIVEMRDLERRNAEIDLTTATETPQPTI
ncbi:Protein aveugle, partial [Fragariocoptes setiger]